MLFNYKPEEYNESKSFRARSIGRVVERWNESGRYQIKRLADIENGIIRPFSPDRNAPFRFKNRIEFYCEKIPQDSKTLGVWDWEAKPNNKDEDKDYTCSSFSGTESITEVSYFPRCKTIKEVVECLKHGFENKLNCEKILFTYQPNSLIKPIEGVLCGREDLDFLESNTRLKSTVNYLPVFQINPRDIIFLDNKTVAIYNKIHIGSSESVFHTTTPFEAIKNLLDARIASKNAIIKLGYSRTDADVFKSIITRLQEPLVKELSSLYRCTDEEANKYVEDFLKKAEIYLTEQDVDIEIVSKVLEMNPNLKKKYKDELTDEWKRENTDIISAEENKIVQLRQESEHLKQQNQELIKERETLKKDLEGGRQFIIDFDSNVKQKIQEAKDNVAEFVSQMTFMSAATAPVPSYQGANFSTGTKIIPSDFDYEPSSSKIDGMGDFEDELAENLQRVGYDEDTANETAQTAVFCLCNKIPLIVGENAVAITRCLAATMGERRLYEMFLTSQDASFDDLSVESDAAPDVCLIHGVLDGYDVRLFNLLSNQLRSGRLKSFIVISLEGVPVRMVPPGIWNHAFYVDGDADLKNDFSNRRLNLCKRTFEFTLPTNDQAVTEHQKQKEKQLKPFVGIITNILRCRYTSYLADFGKNLNDSRPILTQMIAIARSSGIETEEKLASLFRENKIEFGITMLGEFRG